MTFRNTTPKRKHPLFRGFALTATLSLLFQLLAPTLSWALTNGPTMPEVSSFAQIGNDNMVDLFTGDFNYNIPLFNLPGPDGGYPFNLHYNSGVAMEQEASWVGLGFNLNVGAINRQVRGLPDDFKGELIKEEVRMNPTIPLVQGSEEIGKFLAPTLINLRNLILPQVRMELEQKLLFITILITVSAIP